MNRIRVNLGFTRTTKELFLTNRCMILLIDLKPLTFNPKLLPRNQLQIGHKKDDIDIRKEGKTVMNILQLTYDAQTKIYNLAVNVVNAGVSLLNSFWSKF